MVRDLDTVVSLADRLDCRTLLYKFKIIFTMGLSERLRALKNRLHAVTAELESLQHKVIFPPEIVSFGHLCSILSKFHSLMGANYCVLNTKVNSFGTL